MIKTWRSQKFEMTIGKDGGGRDVKRSQRTWDTQTSSWNTWETHYFINSSVLGRTVSETTSTGKKKRSFVIAGGTTIARQVVADNNDESVSWEYADASAQSIRMSGADGTSANADSGSAEMDALGNNVGIHGSLSDPRNSDAQVSPPVRAPISQEAICERGGLVGPCSVVEMLMSGDAGGSATGTLASMGTALPFQFTHDNHLTGRNYRDRFYLAQYENSLSGMIDSGYLQEIAGNNSGGEEGCPGGVCDPKELKVTWNPSTFVYTNQFREVNQKFLVYMPGEEETVKKLHDIIQYARGQEECTKAFKAVDATPIEDQINSISIVTESVFNVSEWDSFWTANSDIGQKMRETFKVKQKTKDLSWTGPYENTGRRFIGIPNNATAPTASEHLSVVVIHSFLHSGGTSGKDSQTWLDWFNGVNPHDLKYLDQKYKDILKHCTRERGSKEVWGQ